MIKPVILISSCRRDRENGNQQAIRDTWGKASVIPYRFFIGDMEAEASDEVGLPWCPDNYYGLPVKTQMSLKWALEQGYTHMFRAFTDTYIDSGRLLEAVPKYGDYWGNPCGFYQDLFYHGGCGYWVSAKLAQTVVMARVDGQKLEDYWVGALVRKYKLEYYPDFRYSMGHSYNRREQMVLPDNDIITEHLSTANQKFDKSLMYDRHSRRFPF